MIAEHLDTARDTLAAEQPAEALRALLAAWQGGLRAPRLGQLIDYVSARLPSAPVEQQHQWLTLARAKDTAALPGLLSTLTAVGFREAQDRADALNGWGDPRISSGLLAMFANPRYRSSGAQWFYGRVFKLLAAQRDPRVPPALSALAGRMHEIITNSYGATLAKLLREAAAAMEVDSADEGPFAPALDALAPFFASERADAERAAGNKARLAAQEAELRARAMAHPDDDGHFLVWADVLTEQGDPRGELMSLQLTEKRTALSAEQLVQLRALQSQHRDRLLGAIAPVVINAVFERGVPVHVELGRQWSHPATPEAEWASVRGVTLPERSEEWAAFLSTLPRLQSVLRVTAETVQQLGRLREGKPPLEHVLLYDLWSVPETFAVSARHLASRDFAFAEFLCAHAGASVTLEGSASPDDTVRALEQAKARVLRFVDGAHLLEPMGWYGWCVEFDTLSRALTVRGRFSAEPDFARLDAWLAACERLRPASTHFDDTPQRDALYLPLTRFDFPQSYRAMTK